MCELDRGNVEGMTFLLTTRALTTNYMVPVLARADRWCVLTGRPSCWGPKVREAGGDMPQ